MSVGIRPSGTAALLHGRSSGPSALSGASGDPYGEAMQLRTIAVGVDGSRNSDRAASVAADLAELTGAQIIAVHALGLLEGTPEVGDTLIERRLAVRDELNTTWTEVLRRTGIKVRCVLRDGNPVMALLAVAEETGADLVVVGRRGHGSIAEQVLGSTSAAVANGSACPVLVVPDEPASD